jgi:hypothetical protein
MCRISEIKIMAIPKGMAIVYPAAEEAAA